MRNATYERCELTDEKKVTKLPCAPKSSGQAQQCLLLKREEANHATHLAALPLSSSHPESNLAQAYLQVDSGF